MTSAARPEGLSAYIAVTASYWAFMLTDGALRMLVLLHFHTLGFTPIQLAYLFLLYEFAGMVTNLSAGWIAARFGLTSTLHAGLGLQVLALIALAQLDPGWAVGVSVAYVMSVQGAINTPLVQDTLALRVTGAYRQRDGFLTAVNGAGTVIGDTNDVDQYLVRAQLGWDTESGMRGRLIADYSKSKSSCCGAIEIFQSPLITGGAYAAVGLGLNAGNGQPSVSTNPFGQPEFEEALDNRVVSLSRVPVADVDNWGVTGEIEFPISDSADLIFIGSYRKYESFESYDSDFTALDIFDVDALNLELETWTAELRLQGEGMDGKLNYVLGGYYSDESIDQSASFSLGQDYGENAGALFFVPTGGAFGANPLTILSGGIDPAGTNNTNRFQQSAQSYSLFTNVSYELAEGLELTLGGRYSWERKDGSFSQTAVNNQICPALLGSIGAGGVPGALVPTTIVLGCFGFTAPVDLPQAQVSPFSLFLPRSFNTSFSDNEFIYTARLAYEFAAPVNVYASFTHGYKAGGINLDTTAAVNGADPAFLSEEVDAYEIGIKSRLIDEAVTLNIAAFHEEFTNFQVLEFTGTAFQTFNVPVAKSTGLEIESLIRPTDELTINASATILDARYPENCAGTSTSITVNSLCGNDLTNAPSLVAIFGALWEKPINDSTEFFIAGQMRMEGDQRTSTQAIVPPTAAQVAALGLQGAIAAQPLIIGDVQDGKVFGNARVGLRFADGAYSIEGFVNNITDEVNRGVTFNTTLRGSGAANSRSAFTLQPRTYGVTVRAKF